MNKVSLLLSLATLTIFGAPQISVEQTSHDFGYVKEGDRILSHSYTVQNTGDDTLRISQVKTSCGCTVAEFDKVIPPNGTGTVTANFNIKGRTGKQQKTIKVLSNSENDALFQLKLTTFIMSPVNIGQRYAILNKIEDQPIKGTLELSTALEGFDITRAYYKKRATGEQIFEEPVTVTMTSKGKPQREEKKSFMERLTSSFKKKKKEDFDPESYITYNISYSLQKELEVSEPGTLFFETNHPDKKIIELRCLIEVKK